jgi:glycine oxidase
VVVCGAGVIGCAVARELAGRGLSVTVIERGSPGDEASGAAAGMLTAQAYAEPGEPLSELGRRSAGLYPALVAELASEAGFEPHYSRCGSVRVPAGPEDAVAMAKTVALQERAGWRLERIDRPRLAELTGSALDPSVREGIAFPDEAVVDPRELVRGLRVAGERRGVRFVTGTPVIGVRVESGACTGVRTPRETIAAGAVVDAAGSWAGFGGGAGFAVPIAPARGQIVELDAGAARPRCVLHRDHFYLAPREHGRLLAGATLEFVGFDRSVTVSGVSGLLRRAVELSPALAEARFVAAWTGFRPAAPDGLPILGETPLPGYFLATAHFRNGILLAPVSARLAADAVTGAGSAAELAPFSLARFLRPPEQEVERNSALQRESRIGKIAER